MTRVHLKNSLTMNEAEVTSKIESGTPYVIRFKVPENKVITFIDSIKGEISINTSNMDDKVLFKSDLSVSYHMANVVDDHLMQITHVIRGDEWVVSTPLHILIYEALGWDKPKFCHLPLVLGLDKTKLSKRKMKEYGFTVFPLACSYVDDKTGETVSVSGFKDLGYEPDAFVNYLALLGWNPGDNKEIMSMDELISLFTLERVNNSGAIFDIVKLNSFNANYMRAKDNSVLFEKNILPYIKANLYSDGVDKTYNTTELDEIVNFAKERCVFSKDLYASVSYFFEPVVLADGVVLKNPATFKDVMEAFMDMHSSDKYEFNFAQINYDLTEFCNVLGVKIGKVLPDLRLALTGGIPGPHLPETMEILGKTESFKRIKSLIEKIEKVAS